MELWIIQAIWGGTELWIMQATWGAMELWIMQETWGGMVIHVLMWGLCLWIAWNGVNWCNCDTNNWWLVFGYLFVIFNCCTGYWTRPCGFKYGCVIE